MLSNLLSNKAFVIANNKKKNLQMAREWRLFRLFHVPNDVFRFKKMHLKLIYLAVLVATALLPNETAFGQCAISPPTQTIDRNGYATIAYTTGTSCARQEYTWSDNASHSETGVTSITWQYSTPGTYIVTLTANDTDSGRPPRPITKTATVIVTGTVDPNPPTGCTNPKERACEIVADRSIVCVGQIVNLSVGTCNPLGGYSYYVWDDGNGTTHNGSDFEVSYDAAGSYCVNLLSGCAEGAGCGTEREGNRFHTITVVNPLPNISATTNRNGGCAPYTATLSVTNPQTGQQYSWFRQGSQGAETFVQTGNSIDVTVDGFASYRVRYGSRDSEPQCPGNPSVVSVYYSTTSQQPSIVSQSYRKTVLKTEPSLGGYWQDTANGREITSPTTQDNKIVYSSRNYFVNSYNSSYDCWTSSLSINATVDYTPPQANISQVSEENYNEVFLRNSDRAHIMLYADYYWVSNETSSATIVKQYSSGSDLVGSKIYENGTYYLRGRDRATNTWGATLTINVALTNFDNSLNWVFARSFSGVKDTAGKLEVVSESKSYFDQRGVALQSQSKSYHRSTANATDQPVVFASQPLTDRYDRTVGSTLAAPILQNDFRYNAAFTLTNTGGPLKYDNFNKSGVLNTLQKGTLGNYYGGSNGFSETNVPATQYPYSLSSFYEDGTGETKMSASPGDQHFLGSTHETLSGTFPVTNELDDYLAKRKSLLGITTPATTLSGAAVQQVVRDANGKYSVAITDKSGKTVMSARPSTTGSEKNCTAILTSQKKIHYFYLLNALNTVTIAGGASPLPYRIEDIVSGQTVTPSGSWSPGFYRIIASPTDDQDTRTLTVTYKNTFTDISYQFYDDAGRLVSSISPKGMEQWATTAYANIDKTTYAYNHQGWLLSMREIDAGETHYKYRRDGKIRFSQNAQQKQNETDTPGKGRFSYTNYDALGRPVESGEYTGTALTFAALNSALEFTSQSDYSTSDKRDWVKTSYDLADPNFNTATGLTALSAFGVQNFVRTSVSFTENANNKTWYSYDELGRVTWMVQKPIALGNLLFTTQYQYDFLGNVLRVSNQTYSKEGTGSPTLLNSFYHHYTYDGNKRLITASTSLDGSTLTLQASYSYYLHGPLKRIELATNLQGIDFVYNINGWLQSINDPSGDPGGDGGSGSTFKKDVFGMVLDYYQSTFGSVKLSSVAPTDFHGLPQFAKASNAPQNPREGQENNEASLPFFKQVLLKNLEQLKVQLQEESGSGQFKNKGTRKVGLVSPNEKNSLGTNKP